MTLTSRRPALLALWMPPALWALLIFAISSIPSMDSGLGQLDLVLRKVAHVTEYAILAALLARAFWFTGPETFRARWATSTTLVAGLFAVSDEIHQAFVPGRGPSPVDVLVDLAGIALAIAVLARRRAEVPS